MKKLLFIAFTLSMLLLTGCTNTSVELTQFVNVNYSGLNSYATADVSFDFGAFENEVLPEIDGTELEQLGVLLALESTISVNIDKTENLSNDDEITATITWDEDVVDELGFSFKGDEVKFTVSDLEDGTVIDLFEGLVVEYNGVSPEATMILGNSSQDAFLKNVTYYSDSFAVANGDEVVITASYNTSEATENNYIIDEDKKTITVEGADQYISSYSELDESTLEMLTNQANDIVSSKLASDYNRTMYVDDYTFLKSDNINIQSNNLVKSYFFTLKDGISKSYNDVNNSIFLVYEIVATDSKYPDGITSYVTIYCSQFVSRDTGEVYFSLDDVRYNKSYSNMNDLYIAVVDYNKAKYSYEEFSHVEQATAEAE